MADNYGFLKIKRQAFSLRPVCERIKDYKEVVIINDESHTVKQALRCMDCGTPFCNWGCPIGNYIPEWNAHANRERWEGAFKLLNETNVLPEITGRVCPALCEYACVLGINDDPVTIRDNELAIIEKAFKEGYIKPIKDIKRTGKKIAVIGSGPAGLSAAAILNYYGHIVTVFEKDNSCGGFLRYGIPDFKLEKSVIERRLNIFKQEGIKFKTGVNVGKDLTGEKLLNDFDVIVLATGYRKPRDLNIKGRELKGIYQAIDYLTQTNKKVAGENIGENIIDAKDKNVVVIGGGDTGADCVGTALRQGAKCVVQIEIMPEPPAKRPPEQPWPLYPFISKKSSSHEEGKVERIWSVMTKEFIGANNNLTAIKCSRCEFIKTPKPEFKEIYNSDFEIQADLVILAMGFIDAGNDDLLNSLNVKKTERGTIVRNEKNQTTNEKVFVAGDAARGPSLVVWAIKEGMETAKSINEYLKNYR